MTNLPTPRYSALGLLAALFLSTAVSLGQTTKQIPADPFAVIPASDALIVLDLSRFSSEALRQLLLDEPEARALVLAVPDPQTMDLFDPRAIQRLVVGVRFGNPNPTDFDVVTVAQTTEAGQLATIVRSRGAAKYREQQYAGKTLFLTLPAQAEAKKEATPATSSGEPEWAVVALDANTLVFGSPAYVRSSIDLNDGKGSPVNAELVTALKRNSKALLSVVGSVPPSVMSSGQELLDNSFGQMLASLKRFYGSVESTPAGFEASVTLHTTGPEHTGSLVEFLNAFKTLSAGMAPARTRQDQVYRDLIKGLVISGAGTEVQIKDQITQATANTLAKRFASGMYFTRGVALVQKGSPDAAIVAYDKAIILDPENATNFINRGKARADTGALDAAISDYDKAISLDPNMALAYNNRCFVHVQKRNFEAAIVDCDKTIALDPTFAYAYNNRGLAFASLGKLDKAMPDYDKSIALEAENIYAYQNRGDARAQIGDYDGSLADFEKVIALDANSAVGYNGRGLVRYYKGEIDQALADYNKALALDPKLAVAYNNRALASVAKGDLDQATIDYDKSIELNDKNEIFYINRGNLQNQDEDWDAAIVDFDKAIALNPKIADAYNGRGLSRFYKEESDQAIADFDRALAISPIPIIYVNRGYARSQKSDYDGAIADFNKALSLDPKLADAYNARGLAQYYKLLFTRALADYDRAIAINPNFAEAYGNRALSLLALRKDAQATQDLNKCFELDESLRSDYQALAKEVRKTRRPSFRKP